MDASSKDKAIILTPVVLMLLYSVFLAGMAITKQNAGEWNAGLNIFAGSFFFPLFGVVGIVISMKKMEKVPKLLFAFSALISMAYLIFVPAYFLTQFLFILLGGY